MTLPSSLQSIGERFGLTLAVDGDHLSIARQDWVAQLHHGALSTLPPAAQAWSLFGVRLGLDRHIKSATDDTDKGARHDEPMRFRRATVRRYHEAPSVHGDHLPLLIPRLARRVCRAIAAEPPLSRSWLVGGLDAIIVHPAGRRIDILTERDQDEADLDQDARWDKVRSALFYQSYKTRPRTTTEHDGGRLRHFRTTEGFGGARAYLLPELDYDASRDYGYAALPSYDDLLIARPNDRNAAPSLLPPLKDRLRQLLADTLLPLGDAIIALEPNDLSIHRPCSESFQWMHTDPAPLFDGTSAPRACH